MTEPEVAVVDPKFITCFPVPSVLNSVVPVLAVDKNGNVWLGRLNSLSSFSVEAKIDWFQVDSVFNPL